MERPTAEGVGRGAGYIAGSNMITSLIAFAFYAAAARILGPRGMGEVTMLFLVIGLYTAVSLMGANYAAARFAAYHMGAGGRGRALGAIARSMELAMVGSAAALAAMAAASPLISRALGIPEGLVLLGLAAGLASNAGSALGGALQGLAMYGDISIQSIMASALSRLPAIALAIPLGPAGVAIAWALGPAAGAAYAAIRLRGRLGGMGAADPVGLREVLGFSAPPLRPLGDIVPPGVARHLLPLRCQREPGGHRRLLRGVRVGGDPRDTLRGALDGPPPGDELQVRRVGAQGGRGGPKVRGGAGRVRHPHGIAGRGGRLLSSLGTIGRIRAEEFRRRLEHLGEAALAAGDHGHAEGPHRVEGGSLDNRGIQARRQQARLRWHREASRSPRWESLDRPAR